MSRTSVWQPRRAVLAAVAAGLVVVVTGCSGAENRDNELRPPIAIDVAVKIGDNRVSVSPTRIGAGPVIITVTNLSSASRRLTIDGPRLKRSVGPINPEDTATLKVTVNPGKHTLSTDNPTAVEPGELIVGPKRPSSQNKLKRP